MKGAQILIGAILLAAGLYMIHVAMQMAQLAQSIQ